MFAGIFWPGSGLGKFCRSTLYRVSIFANSILCDSIRRPARDWRFNTENRDDGDPAVHRLASFTFMLMCGLQLRTVARCVDQDALGLRAGDALHLAICVDHGAALCTLDRRLSEAGAAWA